MVTLSDYSGLKPAWCPGCGNFGILQALNRALVEMQIEPHQFRQLLAPRLAILT
jgi:2-oxoglutarate ferredoxin oxidoreductase subunit beta